LEEGVDLDLPGEENISIVAWGGFGRFLGGLKGCLAGFGGLEAPTEAREGGLEGGLEAPTEACEGIKTAAMEACEA
jgi:hypothetical protein